jgi:PAS domain S-box-containing protein
VNDDDKSTGVLLGQSEKLSQRLATLEASKTKREQAGDRQHGAFGDLQQPVGQLLREVEATKAALEVEIASHRAALRKTEEQYRLIVENVTDIVWTATVPGLEELPMDSRKGPVVDAAEMLDDWRFTFLSPSIERILGYSVEEATSLRLEHLLTPAAYAAAKDALAEELDRALTDVTYMYRALPIELEHVTKDGSFKWCEITSRFLRNQRNQLVGFLGVTRDISKRKRAEQALRDSEERFDLAVRGTDAGIWDWDLRTGTVYFSPRWKEMLGYGEDEIGSDFAEWENRLHPDDHEEALATLQDYLQNGSSDYESEHRLRHKVGSYRWILARGAAVRDRNGEPYRMVGSHIDITGRKEAEETLSKQKTQLLAAQSIQEQLLPKEPPSVTGFDIAGASYPAEFAAGDLFDYLSMPEESLGLVISDVSGHGFASALLMASVQARLRLLAEMGVEIEEILARTNSMLVEETGDDLFITAFIGRLDPRSRRLVYASAGHPAGYVFAHSGAVKALLESTSLPLAILPEIEFPTAEPLVLEPGDLVLLLTDGILETMNSEGEFFGAQRTLEVVRANRHKSSSDIVDSLHQAVRDFSGQESPSDDVTTMVIKVEPPEGHLGSAT